MKVLWDREKGAVTIIEATFVFPIVFFVVFFMIMAGEAYYQYARVEYAVSSAAINGAARCENPMLGDVIKNGKVQKEPSKVDAMPYRYILTGEAKKIADEVEAELTKKVKSFKPLLFRNMTPHNVQVDVDQRMNILVSSFPVTCSFDIPFPITFIFSGQRFRFDYSVKTTATIGDPTEFVRNVAMIADLIERSEAATQFAGKIKEGLKKVSVYIN